MSSNIITHLGAFQEENKNILIEPNLQVQNGIISYVCNLDFARKTILSYLASFWANHRTCWPKQETISFKTGIPLRTVQRILAEFLQQGILTIKYRYNSSNIYLPTREMMARESIRIFKDYFKWAQLFWFRLLLFVFLDPSKLLSDQDLQRVGGLRNSNKYLYIKNCNCTVYYCRSDIHKTDSTVKERSKMSKMREILKAKGFEFSNRAWAEMESYSDEIKTVITDQYSFSYKNKDVDGEGSWRLLMGIAKRICQERSYTPVSSLQYRIEHGIQDTEPRILTYTKPLSDNSVVKNTSSNGKSKTFGTFVDANGVEYWVTPDGGRLRKEVKLDGDYRKVKKIIPSIDVGTPWRVSNPGEPETKEHIRETIFAYAETEEFKQPLNLFGKEEMRKAFNDWLYNDGPPPYEIAAKLKEKQKSNPIQAAHENLSL